ncbi:MAG: hypothetical protein ABIK28_22915 [Planctomycetota bacterium]
MSNSIYRLSRTLLACGWIVAFLILTGVTCHHSTQSGGEAIPFVYSEAALNGRFMGGGISACPEDTGDGPKFTTFFATLNTDGLGAFSTMQYVSNTNGVIEEQEKSGLYEVDTDGNLQLSWEGDMTSAKDGHVIRQGEMAFLNSLHPGDDPGFQILFELGEAGSYVPGFFHGVYWLYGYGFDMTKFPNNVVTRSVEMIVNINSTNNTFNWSRNYWNNWNWVLNEPEFVVYEPGDPLAYSMNADGMISLFGLPNLPELRGAISPGGRLGFLTNLGDDAEPVIFFLSRQVGDHVPAGFKGEYFALMQSFSFINGLHAFTFAELDFDGVNYFSGDYSSNYTLGIDSGFMDGSFSMGIVGYMSMKLFATNRTLIGGSNEGDYFAELITPGGTDNDRSPSLTLFLRR